MSPCVSYVAISGTQLCTERAGSDEETSRGAAALGHAAFDFHPVRPLSEHFDSLDQLRDAVLAANSTTSSLRFHPLGDAPIAANEVAEDLWRPCLCASWPRHGSVVRAPRCSVGAFLQEAHLRAAADHWVRVRSAGTVDHSLCTNSRCDVPKGLGWSSADVLGGGYAVVGAGALCVCVCVLVVLFLQQLDQRRIGSSARHAEARLRAS